MATGAGDDFDGEKTGERVSKDLKKQAKLWTQAIVLSYSGGNKFRR